MFDVYYRPLFVDSATKELIIRHLTQCTNIRDCHFVLYIYTSAGANLLFKLAFCAQCREEIAQCDFLLYFSMLFAE
jgi:hypothetical protein